MDKLIEALQIFMKYKNEDYPTHCEHDVLYVVGISEDKVSIEDKTKLQELGFIWMDEYGSFGSYKFGSA